MHIPTPMTSVDPPIALPPPCSSHVVVRALFYIPCCTFIFILSHIAVLLRLPGSELNSINLQPWQQQHQLELQ